MTADPVATDTAWVGLGSNIGHRGENLARLRGALTASNVKLVAVSPEILTRPVGVTRQGDFHNQVVRLRSPAPWSPHSWLAHCTAAEVAAGRRITYRWGPRVADADILLLGEHGEIRVQEPDLTVPHPELPNRPFEYQLLSAAGFVPELGTWHSPRSGGDPPAGAPA
ncbi:MAG TPA: 2-amino-4-hydroxy-6-hydroxymethyldihydropteridine diphosphokinase [Candidatus Dormibacteraeota bacterium]